MGVADNINQLKSTLPSHVTLVAVSKTKPESMIQEAYDGGQRIFGENKVQELCRKQENLPKDIEWHMIGHLQSNKVKYIAPFVSLIHGVDSIKLLQEINKQGKKNNRVIPVLLQCHIAQEETKFGFDVEEIKNALKENDVTSYDHIEFKGVMGMATFTDNSEQVRQEFALLQSIFTQLKPLFNASFDTISMGMSGDYTIAIEEGSTMIRVGSALFGSR